MMPKCIMLFAMAFGIPVAAAADFHKTYDNAANRRITIFTPHGDIKLSGYDGENIDISAVKKGPDSERVEIEDASFGNQIRIFPKYPEPARNNATVDFEIRVPKEIFYNAEPDAGPDAKSQGVLIINQYFQKFPGETPAPKVKPGPKVAAGTKVIPAPRGEAPLSHAIYLKSNSGQITISDVAGSIRAETLGRSVEMLNVGGILYVFSLTGDIKALLGQTSHRGPLQFSSSSGSISVQAPDDINAQIYIQSANGQVKTDFPLETKEMRYGPGKFIQGKLGDGNQILNIRSLSGAINFSKKPPEKNDK